MRKRICAFLLLVGLTVGTSLLVMDFVFGICNNAYAYPRYGKNCAACHTSKGSSKNFTSSFMLEDCNGFSSTGTNPYFVLTPGYQLTLEGKKKRHTAHLRSPFWTALRRSA